MSGEALTWIYASALLILGFVLILLEIFVIPGLNIFGVLGFLAVAMGVVFAYLKLGTSAAVAVGGLAVVATLVLMRVLVRQRAWHRLVLDSDTGKASGYQAVRQDHSALKGKTGTTKTPLRPAGRAAFGDKLIDVVSAGDFVQSGEQVEVVLVRGNRVVVQPHSGGGS